MDTQRSKIAFFQFLSLPTYLMFASVFYLVFYVTGFIFTSQSINYITIFIGVSLTIKDWINRTNGERKFTKADAYMPLFALGFIAIRLMATTTHAISFNISVIIILACSLVVFFRCVKKSKRKIILGVVYSLLSGLVFFIASAGLFFSILWSTPVETGRMSELSPNGVHIVEAVQRSEGALGGSTIVTVQRTSRFNLLLGEFQHRPQQVHRGNWSEYFNIKNVRWDGNDRFYMYRSGSETCAFELAGFRWSRVD